MTDQGWMVDDGICDQCVDGDCWDCDKPTESYGDGGTDLICCCNEGCHIGWVDEDEDGPP